jgi:thioredoxin-related protein
MKVYLALFIAVALFSINKSEAQNFPLPTDEILKEASAQAARENKNVFLLFHASWCGWCRKMDTAMNDISIKDFFDKNFVIKHLVVYETEDKKNLENPGALDLLIKYKGNNQGIPYWIVFDANRNLLADSQITPGVNTGCPATKDEVDHFIKVMKRTTSLSSDQLNLISKRFLKNAR